MPEARVSRRAGRGKSASPVRRGESGPRSCVALSPTLPARKEYYVIESANPEVMGLDGAARSQVEYLYELAG